MRTGRAKRHPREVAVGCCRLNNAPRQLVYAAFCPVPVRDASAVCSDCARCLIDLVMVCVQPRPTLSVNTGVNTVQPGSFFVQ